MVKMETLETWENGNQTVVEIDELRALVRYFECAAVHGFEEARELIEDYR